MDDSRIGRQFRRDELAESRHSVDAVSGGEALDKLQSMAFGPVSDQQACQCWPTQSPRMRHVRSRQGQWTRQRSVRTVGRRPASTDDGSDRSGDSDRRGGPGLAGLSDLCATLYLWQLIPTPAMAARRSRGPQLSAWRRSRCRRCLVAKWASRPDAYGRRTVQSPRATVRGARAVLTASEGRGRAESHDLLRGRAPARPAVRLLCAGAAGSAPFRRTREPRSSPSREWLVPPVEPPVAHSTRSPARCVCPVPARWASELCC